jgi:sec-independent protein translocase protein TatB
MFDISFVELLTIGIVALVVIGPERLPGVARTVGHLLGRARRYVGDVKADINRELQLEELKKLQAQAAESMREVESTVQEEVEAARSAFVSPAQAAVAELEATARNGLLPALTDSVPVDEPALPASAASHASEKPAA